MKKTRLVIALALVLTITLALSMTVGARNGPFNELEEALGDYVLVPDPEFIDGGTGFGAEGTGEHAHNLFDGILTTKYCANLMEHGSFWAEWRYAEPFVAAKLLLATANDSATNPRRMDEWTLYGSNDGENWTVIHEDGADVIYHYNFMWFYVSLDNDQAFTHYRFYAEFPYDSNLVQLSRMELAVAPGAAAPPPVVETPPTVETPPAVEAPPAAQPTPPAPTPAAAPATFDPITLIAVGAFASVAGAVVIKRRKK